MKTKNEDIIKKLFESKCSLSPEERAALNNYEYVNDTFHRQYWKSHPINQRRKSVINIAKEKMQSKKRICKCLLPNSIYRFLFILFLQNEHVLYFSNAFINSFFTVSTPGKPVCF